MVLDSAIPREEPRSAGGGVLGTAWGRRLFWLVPFLLALLIMLPRLASPQFGLLDDGNSLRTARLLASGNWQLGDVAVGRSRPLYWLFWSLPYFFAGPNPFWYFLANLASLIALVACVVLVSRALGLGVLPAWLTAIIFLLDGPVVESFYTLSKGEPLQLILILLALNLALRSSTSKASRAGLAAWVLIPILTFLAGITKETVLVMLPISLAWVVAAYLGGSAPKSVDRSSLRSALVGFAVGGACFLIYRAATVGPELLGTGYASGFQFSLARILDSGSRWLAWILRDFSFLLPLSVMPVIWWRKREGPSRIDVLLGSMIWMSGWLAIFLPWLFVTEYYLLPFSLGAAIFGSVLAADAIAILGHRSPVRTATFVLLVLAGLLFCTNLINFSTTARLQLAVDESNAAVIRFLASEVPQTGTVIVNIQDPTEYVSQVGLHLAEFYNRTDVHVTYLDPAVFSQGSLPGDLFIASPYIENQVLLSNRLGVYEPNMRTWTEAIAGFVRAHSQNIYHQRRTVRVFAFDPARAICPFFAGGGGFSVGGLPVESILRYCQGGSMIDRREFLYGWDVYRLDLP